VFLEARIKAAQWMMRAGYFVARAASAWLTKLVLQRTPERIAQMEQEKGLL